MFDIYYKKNKNKNLFKNLEKYEFKKIQNYVPLYSKYFSLSNNNYNSINLNHKFSIIDMIDNIDKNKYKVKLIDKSNNTINSKSFFKYSPLLDPIKYITGKYKNENISELPLLNNSKCNKKLLDTNNTAYVDSFFSYLSSQLLNNHYCLNCIDFYGSFIGIQNKFSINIIEDIDYVYASEYFHKNKDVLFDLQDFDIDLLENESRKYRKKIELNDDIETTLDVLDENLLNSPFVLTENNLKIHNSILNNNLIYDKNNLELKNEDLSASEKSTDSNCSSRTSNTSNDSEDEEDVPENDEDNESSLESCTNSNISEYSSNLSDKEVISNIFNFPIQIICMEQLDNTLDALIEDTENELTVNEWKSALIQIIFTLIMYQKSFDFTHNDLHTNNVMYIETDKKFLYYKYDNKYYKVPTYGKIFKIIDFGRAIYKYKGNLICSDSFRPNGDAATQYNFEPYFNENKPRLEPNMSFDLCRLGCSIFDYFVEDIDEIEMIEHPIAKLIIKWCTDDKNRNILYKTNGEERYPEFKLYKMIARTVHNHTPNNEIQNPLFEKYITSKRKINKKTKIINIDNLPRYV